jgi:S-formylglutathione hydrolase
VENGKVRPEIVAKWVANAPLEMVPQYVANLQKYYSIGIEVGTKDSLYGSNVQLHNLLTKLNIRHVFEEYDGDHTNRVKERIERNTLPFFARYLASPTNPTSPSAAADLLAPTSK